MFHHPLFYKHIHKKHHEWQSPIAVTAVYAHPLEHMISNLGSVASGPVLMQSHLCMVWLWYILTVLVTLADHSGYHLPFYRSPEFHDYHHLK